MLDPAISPHFVSHGPPDTSGGASDWCALPLGPASLNQQHVAPGGVVLCKRGTTELHPEATRYAREAWATYGHYLADITPGLADNWAPPAIAVTAGGTPVRWIKWDKGDHRYVRLSQKAPGGWYLLDLSDRYHARISVRAEYYAECEWAALGRAHKGVGSDNMRARGSWSMARDWMPPIPILTDAIVQGMNKYNRRAKTTPKERAEGLAKIKRLVKAEAS